MNWSTRLEVNHRMSRPFGGTPNPETAMSLGWTHLIPPLNNFSQTRRGPSLDGPYRVAG
jgi:hypothetical protein